MFGEPAAYLGRAQEVGSVGEAWVSGGGVAQGPEDRRAVSVRRCKWLVCVCRVRRRTMAAKARARCSNVGGPVPRSVLTCR